MDDARNVWNEFQFVAYNGGDTYDPSDPNAAAFTTPLGTVQIFKEKRTGPSQPQVTFASTATRTEPHRLNV
eukprot:491890-Pyramimonas_sp.AAC.1